MITKEQYEAALETVAEYEDQKYATALEQVRRDFPIGSYAESRNGMHRGVVYGYGRAGNEVTLKVRGQYYTNHFFAKSAKQIKKE